MRTHAHIYIDKFPFSSFILFCNVCSGNKWKTRPGKMAIEQPFAGLHCRPCKCSLLLLLCPFPFFPRAIRFTKWVAKQAENTTQNRRIHTEIYTSNCLCVCALDVVKTFVYSILKELTVVLPVHRQRTIRVFKCVCVRRRYDVSVCMYVQYLGNSL